MKKFIILAVIIFAIYKYFTGEQGSKAVHGAYLGEGVTITSRARAKVRKYYYMSKTLPESASDVGAGRPDSYKGESLIKLEFSHGGVITLTFDKKSGVDGGTIIYTPVIEDSHFSWACTTSDYRDIALALPNCSYKE